MSKWTQEFKYNLPRAYVENNETSPLYLRYLLTSKGFACPDFSQGNCLEIGTGNGVGFSVKTMCSTAHWKGLEFNPTLVNKTLRRAKQCHIKLDLTSDDLASFVKRPDLPKFDLICVDFVWSWISKEDQELIIDLVKNNLNEGGVFYVSYNCTTGMTNFESVRDLMKLYDTNKHNNSVSNKDKVLSISKFLYPIMELNPCYVIAQPDFAQRIQQACFAPDQFLSENINTYWHMEHFSELAKRLDRADMGFVCSANGADHLDHINLTQEQIEFLQPLLGTSLYEECHDFMVDQRYRYDVFMKGAVPLNTNEFLDEFASQNIVMITNAANFDYKLAGNNGEVELPRELYEPLIALLSDNQSHNIGMLINTILSERSDIETSDLIAAINTLVFSGICAVAAHNEEISPECLEQNLRMNLNIINSFSDNENIFVGSPLLQSPVALPAIDAHMLRIFVNTPDCTDLHLVEGLLQLCVSGQISLNSDGQLNDEQIIKATTECVAAFLSQSLPLYSKLLIV